MSVTRQPLIQSVTLTNVLTLEFTASATTTIDAMTLYNPIGNAAETVTIEWVKSGGATGTASKVTEHVMQAGEVYSVWGMIGQTLGIGDKIYAQGATGGLVNLFASGTVIS